MIRNWDKKITTAEEWENNEDTSRCDIFFRIERLNKNNGDSHEGHDRKTE